MKGSADIDESDSDRQSEMSLSLQASYEIDLWGRIRSEIEAERLEATATAEDYQVAAVTLLLYQPTRVLMSVLLTPQALTRMRASTGPGSGTGTSSWTWSTSGPPRAVSNRSAGRYRGPRPTRHSRNALPPISAITRLML